MNETRKANKRRLYDPLFRTIFQGRGIDIGCGDDMLTDEGHYPDARCVGFDKVNGNAEQIGNHFSLESFDFVYSSHCLEHCHSPGSTLWQWFSLVRPGGHLVVVVPDKDLYEQGQWPSQYNTDHKWMFTLGPPQGAESMVISVPAMCWNLLERYDPIRMALIDTHYDYSKHGVDQSLGAAEVSIEFVLRKRFH